MEVSSLREWDPRSLLVRPSPFPSALIQRGDSWPPLPRVELIQKVSTKTVNIDCVFRRGEPFWSPIRSGAPERSLPSVCKTVKKDCMFRRGGINLNRFGLRVFRLYYPIERFRLRILRRSKTPEIQCRFDRMKTPRKSLPQELSPRLFHRLNFELRF